MAKLIEYPPKPTREMFPSGLTEARDAWYKEMARLLDPQITDDLVGLVRYGPLYDGDVPSKSGRSELIRLGLASKIVVSGHAMPQASGKYVTPPPLLPADEVKPGFSWGYQAATYEGAYVYQAMIDIGRIKP